MEWAYNACADSGLGYSHLLDLIDPPPPPKAVDEEEEEEPEDDEGPPKPVLPQFLVDQRDARALRVELEQKLNNLQNEMQRKDTKVDGLLETGKKYYDQEGQPIQWKGNMRPRPDIEAEIDVVKSKLGTAKYEEEDTSVICIGRRAADVTHAQDAHPISCSFEGLVVSEEDGTPCMWANATIKVDENAPTKPSDVLLMVDVSKDLGAGPGGETNTHLAILKRSLLDLVADMEASDRCALLAYGDSAKVYNNTEAEEPSPWINMDANGKQQMALHIGKLKAAGEAKIKPAMDLAFTTLTSTRAKAISTALLFSGSTPLDGRDQFFLGKTIPTLCREGTSINFNTTMSVLGIGTAHDPELMAQIASAGHGSYISVPSPVLLSEQLGRLMDSSRRTVVSGLHLVFEGCSPCSLLEVEPGYGVSTHDCTRPSSYFRTQKVMCVEIGALHAGQERSVLFKVQLPSQDMVNKLAVNTPLARFLSIYSAGADKKGIGVLHLHHHTLRVMDVPRLTCKTDIEPGVPLRVAVSGDASTLEVSVVRQALADAIAGVMASDGLGPALTEKQQQQMRGYFKVDGVTQNAAAMDNVMRANEKAESIEAQKAAATMEWKKKVDAKRKQKFLKARLKEKADAAAAVKAEAEAAAAAAAAAAPPPAAEPAPAAEGEEAPAAAEGEAAADAAPADAEPAAEAPAEAPAAEEASAPAEETKEEEEEEEEPDGVPEVFVKPEGVVSLDFRFTDVDPSRGYRALMAMETAFSTGLVQEKIEAALKAQADREAETARKAAEAFYNSPDEKKKRADAEAAVKAEAEAAAAAEAEAAAVAAAEAEAAAAAAEEAGTPPPEPEPPVEEVPPVPEPEWGAGCRLTGTGDPPPPPAVLIVGDREVLSYSVPGASCAKRLAQVHMCKALATSSSDGLSSTLALQHFPNCDPVGFLSATARAQTQISSADAQVKYACLMAEQQQKAQCASAWPPLSRYLTKRAARAGELLADNQWSREQVPARMEAVSVVAVSKTCVTVDWTPPDSNMLVDENGNKVGVVEYTLRVVKAGGMVHGKSELVRRYEAPRKQCCVDQLEAGTYFFSISATNGKWRGASSDASKCVVEGAVEVAATPETEDTVDFIKVETGSDRAWKWYPALKMWEQLPPGSSLGDDDTGAWPPRVTHAQVVQQQIPLAPEIAASPSSVGSIEIMWQQKYWDSSANATSTSPPPATLGGGEVSGGCAPIKTYHVAVVCDKTGKQVSQVYDSSVSDCCVQGLGGDDSNGQYHVSVYASNGLSLGMLSPPVLVRTASRKVPSSAENTFEFTIGGVRFRRPADL